MHVRLIGCISSRFLSNCQLEHRGQRTEGSRTERAAEAPLRPRINVARSGRVLKWVQNSQDGPGEQLLQIAACNPCSKFSVVEIVEHTRCTVKARARLNQ